MSTSPTPEGSNATGPAPQAIGVRFVKAYYQVLTTNPDQIFKFYQASSILSHGEGSNPTNASAFATPAVYVQGLTSAKGVFTLLSR